MTQAELETPRDPADIYDAQTPEDAAELLNRPLPGGTTLRHQLTNPQIRSTVRKDLRKLLAEASSP